MKKILCAVMILVSLIGSTAYGEEILFRDIPWGSNPMEFEQALYNEGTFFEDMCSFDRTNYTLLYGEVHSSWGVETQWKSAYLPQFVRYISKDVGRLCCAGTYNIDAISVTFLPSYKGVDLNYPMLESSYLHEVSYIITSFEQGSKNVPKEDVFDDLILRLTETYGQSVNQPILDMPIARYWVDNSGASVIIKPVDFEGENSAIHIIYQSGLTHDYLNELVEAYNATMNTEGGL